MNKQEKDILMGLLKRPYENQRILSENTGHSLGMVNRSIKNMIKDGYLNNKIEITEKAKTEISRKKPRNAIILAAGFGMRMAPINLERPKALIEVNGEVLIERLIRQLHEVGIEEIYVIVGFMKEAFEYLIDQYGVKLVINNQYSSHNNLYSLSLVGNIIHNSYIVPCDIWCKKNPFNKNELYSWYMISDLIDDDSEIRVNRKMELVLTSKNQSGNTMIGIAYLDDECCKTVSTRLKEYVEDGKHADSFWEEVLYNDNQMIVQANIVSSSDYIEINTYEQLRKIDEESKHLESKAITIASKVMKVGMKDIVDISVLKKGMTNRSFIFSCGEKRYIMRIPGEGTEQLINRENEVHVYNVIKGKNICDNVVYIDSKTGYKITEYIENARVCDATDENDLILCMKKLRDFHGANIQVQHDFDLFQQIEYYESLWNGNCSIYRDYLQIKRNVWELKEYVDKHIDYKCLTHIDAVPDNFLFAENKNVKLIDWEYAGMQDPHVDIAMFCIYSLYDKAQIDHLIDIYFEKQCKEEIRIKIYCYIAIAGLLWSNWCEYKRNLGVEFGEYALKQYRYAKEYYKIATEHIRKLEDE